MKKYLSIFPMFILLVATSCSETATVEEPKEEVQTLLEREPEVREYLEVVDELVDEYLTLGEEFLDNLEKMESGDMGTMEQVQAIAGMSEAALEISELAAELEGMDEKKTKLESKLDADDIIELGIMFSDKMQRFYDLAKRVDESGYMDVSTSIEDYF